MDKQHRHLRLCNYHSQRNRRYVSKHIPITSERPRHCSTTDHHLMCAAGMFANNHHSLVGSDEDPPDGGKVAVAVFSAVAIYGVRKSIPHNAALGIANVNQQHRHFSSSADVKRLCTNEPADEAR